MPSAKKILLVEDDENLGFVVKDNLTLKGFDVTLCRDGVEAERKFFNGDFNLCILDVMLPRKDGFTLAQTIRATDKQVPILFLTAKSMTEDKLQGFETGGDDYITKPFSMDELVYRIEVFLRRSNTHVIPDEKTFQIGKFHFDYSNLLLRCDDQQKPLTKKEAEVLRLLYVNRGRVMKREEILTEVWGDDDYFMGRSMDVFISKLRKYLRDDPAVQIVNYHGIGFRLEEKAV